MFTLSQLRRDLGRVLLPDRWVKILRWDYLWYLCRWLLGKKTSGHQPGRPVGTDGGVPFDFHIRKVANLRGSELWISPPQSKQWRTWVLCFGVHQFGMAPCLRVRDNIKSRTIHILRCAYLAAKDIVCPDFFIIAIPIQVSKDSIKLLKRRKRRYDTMSLSDQSIWGRNILVDLRRAFFIGPNLHGFPPV